MTTHSKDVRERIEKIMSAVVYTARHSYSLDEEIIVEPTQAIESLLVEARIDQLNQIRHSDVKLNHGTIELMGYMSQELNKEKLRLKSQLSNKEEK